MSNKEAVWKLIVLLKEYKKTLLFIMGGLLISSVLNLWIPLLSKQIMDFGFIEGDYRLLIKLVLLSTIIYIVNLFIDVNVPPVLPFQAADLGILFGNIIDNAIEAVLPNSDSSNTIKLLARYEKETLIVTCINSYKGKLIFNPSGELITSKSDSTNHGYGIYSIKKVATKYHGSVSIDFNNSMFTIKVLLCNF